MSSAQALVISTLDFCHVPWYNRNAKDFQGDGMMNSICAPFEVWRMSSLVLDVIVMFAPLVLLRTNGVKFKRAGD
ncbi:hypothetical protein Tco_1058455 [Tanacetum coccineum]|uniref:Uncharacterized protein n=1 Tax=Tanacetum coccineum TaxID=301880 RepID=A0ABQ5HAC0_9ASTR